MMMETSYCLLNAKEFRKVMGAEPRAKDPRIQTVQLPNEAGIETQYYVFKAEANTANHFRILKLQTWYDVSRTSRVMQSHRSATSPTDRWHHQHVAGVQGSGSTIVACVDSHGTCMSVLEWSGQVGFSVCACP